MRTLRVTVAAFALLGGMTGLAAAGSFQEKQKLIAGDGASDDYFGSSVSVSGDHAVVGAPYGSGSGSAYVFELQPDGTWLQIQKLLAGDGAPGDLFGSSVSTAADVAIIGAWGDDDSGADSGSAYIFERQTNGSWVQVRKILASDGSAGDYFGSSVSLSGDHAIVGASRDDNNGADAGSAYIFERQSNGSWTQVQKLLANDGAAGDMFGHSVSASDDHAIAGASGDDDNGTGSGSAYIFERQTNGSWTQVQKLLASDGTASDFFGNSVSVSGDNAVVGAPGDSFQGAPLSGAAYMFEQQPNGAWTETQRFSNSGPWDAFGLNVSLSGDHALIGASGNDDNGANAGAAYFVERQTNGQWTLSHGFASDGAAGGNFGSSVSVSGERAIIGSHGDDDSGLNSGSAYVFDFTTGPPPPPPPPPFVAYGAGCFGTGGIVPAVAMSGSATPGGQIQLDILNCVGSGTAFIFMGLQQAAAYMGYGCTLNVSPLLPAIVGPLPLFPFGAHGPGAGSISIPATLPASITPPVTFTLQAFINDPGGKGGYSNTNGVELNIQ